MSVFCNCLSQTDGFTGLNGRCLTNDSKVMMEHKHNNQMRMQR